MIIDILQKRPAVEAPTREKKDVEKELEDLLASWKLLAAIAKCQGEALVNFHQWWPQFVLAPAVNYQEILSRWVIGRQVNIYKSSDAALEETIRTGIAGYGSQLGTILDYLERLQQELQLPVNLLDPKDPVEKLNDLIEKVRNAKKLAGRA